MRSRLLERASLGLLLTAGCAPDLHAEPEQAGGPLPKHSVAAPSSELPRVGRAAPVGGDWLRCYGSFVPRTEPRHDLARLSGPCGAQNRMRKRLGPIERTIVEGGKPVEHRFRVVRGGCYRVFAVGEPSVGDLDVEVLTPDGRRVAHDTGEDRWPIVEPDRPFCAFETGEYRAVVRAQRGAGRYALAIHELVEERMQAIFPTDAR